ncbi:MAG TPA: arsenate reductase (glutaredoxin) [Caulobacteraceae bacterium]|jgi:arsenate reductase|nr:arsenate reductase (glutaredoxin) [Caulobacteraceae bacterium]
MADDITIFHNPACSTSRKVLEAIRAAGREPRVVDYLKTGWTAPQLKALFAKMGVAAREALRTRNTQAHALGLTTADDDKVIAAMVADPVLVERPIIETPKAARLCRPVETVNALL